MTTLAASPSLPDAVDEREAFEQAARALRPRTPEDSLRYLQNLEWDDEDGEYVYHTPHHAWTLWQARASLSGISSPPEPAPIDMVLHCPACGMQHVDAPESVHMGELTDAQKAHLMLGPQYWGNPPHRSHFCHGCGHIWRPADVPTNGVAAVKTKGKADSALASPPVAPKPLDDLRLQELFSSAILGALAFGAQDMNQPPEGHWLTQFWQLARAERSSPPEPPVDQAVAPPATDLSTLREALEAANNVLSNLVAMPHGMDTGMYRSAKYALERVQMALTEGQPEHDDSYQFCMCDECKRNAE